MCVPLRKKNRYDEDRANTKTERKIKPLLIQMGDSLQVLVIGIAKARV
jgi:hypothetical protein